MMKKLMLIVLSAFVVLGLCACAGGNTETEPATTAATTAAATEATTEATTEAATEETTEATEQEEPAELDNKALAKSCIDKSVEELYALIGQPESSDYASSCLGEGDDGMLYYDGFIVYTYREGDKETVSYVE